MGFAQIRLAPLLRAEALYLLGDISIGFVVCARGEMTAELEALMDDGMPATYLAESVDETTLKGWNATFSGPAEVVVDPALRRRCQQLVPGFEAGPGTRVLRLRLRSIEGHRFQRMAATS